MMASMSLAQLSHSVGSIPKPALRFPLAKTKRIGMRRGSGLSRPIGSLRRAYCRTVASSCKVDIAELWDRADAHPSWQESSFSIDVTPNGRGVVVRPGSHVSAGDTILAMPLKSAVVADEATIGICCDTHLALLLLQKLNDPGSFFSDYGPYLPESVDSCALWSERELSELQCEQVAESARAIQGHIEAQYEELDFLPDGLQSLSSGGVTWEDFQWAMTIVHSRSFAVTTPAGRRLRCIIPFADMFNHGCSSGGLGEDDDEQTPSGAVHSWGVASSSSAAAAAAEDEETTFEITAAHDVPEGHEMLISYGLKKNADLLMEYGFVLSDNIRDCTIVYDDIMGLIDDDEFRPETDTFKELMLKEEMVQSAISPMDYVAVRPGGRCEHVLGLLRVLYAHVGDLELLCRTPDNKEGCDVFAWSSGAMRSPRVMAAELEALDHLVRRCSELLESFPTSCSEDEQILQDIDNGDAPQHTNAFRLQMAVEFRLQSKRILCDTMEHLSDRSAQIVEEQQGLVLMESSRG